MVIWPLKKCIFGKYERLVDIKLKGFFSSWNYNVPHDTDEIAYI